jgi:uncharacterized protein YacL
MMIKLVIISILLILSSGYIAFQLKRKRNPNLTFDEFLHGTHFTPKVILVSMVAGLVFGFIDNISLWFGMDALESWFKLHGISGNAAAGYGNTYSAGLAAFMGTFLAIIASEILQINVEDGPVWANAIGIIVGSLLGIFISTKLNNKNLI